MTLLEFARGPGLQGALLIFSFGVLWRLVGTFLLLRNRDLAQPKGTSTIKAGMRAIVMRSIPPHELEKKITSAPCRPGPRANSRSVMTSPPAPGPA